MGRVKFVGTVPVDASQIEQSFREVFSFHPVAAALQDLEIPLGFLDSQLLTQIESISLIVSADITKDNTNYTTFNIYNRGADGTGTDVVATTDTKGGSGTVAKLVRTALTVDATKRIVKGNLLTLAVAKSGNGVAIPGFALEFKFKQ